MDDMTLESTSVDSISDEQITNSWELPQERADMREWVALFAPKMNEQSIFALTASDPEDAKSLKQTQDTLDRMLNDDRIIMDFDLNDATDYSVPFYGDAGQTIVARVSEVVTINGVRWHLFPGRNWVPRIVYEYLMTIEDMRKNVKYVDVNHWMPPNTSKQIYL